MYDVGDAEQETSVKIGRRHCEGGFDSVVGIFLFPYASSREQLKSMCKTAFGALRPGIMSNLSHINNTACNQVFDETLLTLHPVFLDRWAFYWGHNYAWKW